MPFVVLHYIFFNPFNLTTILNQWLPGFSYSAGHKWWSRRDGFSIYNYNQGTFCSYEMIRHVNLSGLTVNWFITNLNTTLITMFWVRVRCSFCIVCIFRRFRKIATSDC